LFGIGLAALLESPQITRLQRHPCNNAKLLPAWFRVLSATADPGEYARRIDETLKQHFGYGRTKMLTVAKRIATPAQRRVLPK
jgi:hypothetical protein